MISDLRRVVDGAGQRANLVVRLLVGLVFFAIATTKIPLLWRATAVSAKVGFWSMQAESRTDLAMLLGLVFLLLAGPGPLSLDGRSRRRKTSTSG